MASRYVGCFLRLVLARQEKILDFRFQGGNQGKGSLSGERFRPDGVVPYARSGHRKLAFQPLAYSLAVVL